MILSGEKKHEYREMKKYWDDRLINRNSYDVVCFVNGYGHDKPAFTIELKGIVVATGNEAWGAVKDVEYYVLLLGNIISKRYIK